MLRVVAFIFDAHVHAHAHAHTHARAVPLQAAAAANGPPLPLRSEGNAAVRQGTLASLGLPPSFLPCARQGCDGWMDEKNARDGDRGWT